jgi:HAD superfamily hydrolase (TIGR01509 family)
MIHEPAISAPSDAIREAGVSHALAVILDMDGLMFDTERLARIAWARALAEQGYAIPETVYLTVVGRSAPAVWAVFRERLGPAAPIEAMHRVKERYLEETLAAGVPLKPGLLELLAALDRWAVPTAVASSTARDAVLRKLDRAGLGARFPVVVGGDEVARSKPAPDIFLTAADRLAVPPAACVVLEDSEAGVRAARAAGMRALLVPDLVRPGAECAALCLRVLPSLHEAIALLGEMRDPASRSAEASPAITPRPGAAPPS